MSLCNTEIVKDSQTWLFIRNHGLALATVGNLGITGTYVRDLMDTLLTLGCSALKQAKHLI